MNYEGLFDKIWWWKEQLCINYLVWFLGNIASRKSLICQYQRDIRFQEQMLYRKSMPYDMVWTTVYKVIIKNVNKLIVIQYKRELGFFFSIQGSINLIALNDRDCRDDKGFPGIIYFETNISLNRDTHLPFCAC